VDTKDFGAGLRITPRSTYLLIFISSRQGCLWLLTMVLHIALFARDDRR
jgi:hypothetical protein